MLAPSTLHSFMNQDQSNLICHDQKRPFPGSMSSESDMCAQCENCGQPIQKRSNVMSQLQVRFCSDQCARFFGAEKMEKHGLETNDEASEITLVVSEGEQTRKTNWDPYLRDCQNNMAPEFYFVSKNNTFDVPGLNPGMKLEAIDKNNPQSFCVATVVQVVGHRLRVRYDGYGKDGSNDIWCNFQAEELHPIGWCAQNGFPLQPPNGIKCTLEEWRTFLTRTLTGALAAPRELFRKEHFQPRVHGFKIGMKLEVIHPAKPSVICRATVVKSLGPYYFLVATDYIKELPNVTFCCHSDSGGIFPVGWSFKSGVGLAVPSNCTKKTFTWDSYISSCHATYAPQHLFKKMRAHKFKAGLKLEAVDLEKPSVVRVATVSNVMGKVLKLHFDGQSRFQFVENDSPDIYPIGWCKNTGHPLHTPYGKVPFKTVVKYEGSEFNDDKLKMISFADVISRKNSTPKIVPATTPTSQSSLATVQRKTAIVSPKPEEPKEKKADKSGTLSPSDDEDDISDDEGNATGCERFYHNKNQIYFNKGCCCGPLLNPNQVKLLPDATEPGKVSTVIRAGLEKVAACAKDPEKVMGMMQEGSGVRVVVRHKGRVLKKAISRVDSRPKLERYLKRFCRRLVCCEYFLTLTPVPCPCPDKCQTDEHGNLQGPKGLKAKRSREYFETKHLGYEKKKRGRKSKAELATSETAAQRAAAGIVTTVFHKGDRVPLPNLDLPVAALTDHIRNAATKTLRPNALPTSENRILPKPVLPSTTVLTPTNSSVSVTNNVPTSSATVQSSFGKPRLLPSSRVPPVRKVNPPESQAPKAVRFAAPAKDAMMGKPPGEAYQTRPTLPRSKMIQQPISPRPEAPCAGTITYALNPTSVPNNKLPLPPHSTAEKRSLAPSSSAKPFRLAPPKFTAPPSIAPSTSNPTQPRLSPRFLAVRQPMPHTVNYRFPIQPRPQITTTPTSVVTTYPQAPTSSLPTASLPTSSLPNSSIPTSSLPCSSLPVSSLTTSSLPISSLSFSSLPVSSTPARVGPPPLIPAQPLPGVPKGLITSQSIPVAKAHLQRGHDGTVVTAAPNVCVTERGTFVTTQMSKTPVPTSSLANPIIGQSPDANAMMNKMFSVVRYSENGTVPLEAPASSANSGKQLAKVNSVANNSKQSAKVGTANNSNQQMSKLVDADGGKHSSKVNPSKVETSQAHIKSSRSGPSGHKLSINVGGGMGAVTTAVRSGLLTKEKYQPRMGSTNGISERSITQGGGFSITINESNLDSNATAADSSPNEGEDNDGAEDGKTESEPGTPSKKGLWAHRRRKKKRARFTYVKGKGRKKKEGEMFAQMNDEQEGAAVEHAGKKANNEGDSVLVDDALLFDGTDELVKQDHPSKLQDKDGKRKGRPQKRLLDNDEHLGGKSSFFDVPQAPQAIPKRFQKTLSSSTTSWVILHKNPSLVDNTPQDSLRQPTAVTNVSTVGAATEAATVSSAYATSPKAKFMKGVLHAVQSSQHPSVKLRSPLGKQSHSLNGFTSPPTKRARLLSPGSLTHRKTRGGLHAAHPQSSSASSTRLTYKRTPTYANVGINTSLPGCPSNKCNHLPQNPNTWTIEQVGEYIRATDCKNYATMFMDQEIDGESLVLLTRNTLMQFTNMKLGPTLKMSNYIAQLRARAGLSNMM